MAEKKPKLRQIKGGKPSSKTPCDGSCRLPLPPPLPSFDPVPGQIPPLGQLPAIVRRNAMLAPPFSPFDAARAIRDKERREAWVQFAVSCAANGLNTPDPKLAADYADVMLKLFDDRFAKDM